MIPKEASTEREVRRVNRIMNEEDTGTLCYVMMGKPYLFPESAHL
jgi:hypothetical protein